LGLILGTDAASMWSKAERGLFVRFAALYLILTFGVASALTALATDFFGYGGAYTPELLATSFLVSLIGAWITLRRLKRRILRGDDVIGPVKEIEAHPYAPEERMLNYIFEFLKKKLGWRR
jgi:hypothetical protein